MSDEPETRGVTMEVLGTVDLGPEIEGMEGRQLRMRMVTIESGGVFGPLHDHRDRPGSIVTLEELDRWLDAYGRAWERQDTDALLSCFAEDAVYQWGPWGDTLRGHAQLGAKTTRRSESRRTSLSATRCSRSRPTAAGSRAGGSR
jgi:hypothetical protein